MGKWGKWAIVAVGVFIVSRAFASRPRPLPLDQWTPHTKTLLAQMLKIEAENNTVDHAALPHTLVHWWNQRGRNIAFDDLIQAYSSGFRENAPQRAQIIRRMSFGEFSPQIQAAVNAFYEGTLPNPTPSAIHWAANNIDRSSLYREVTPRGAANRYWALR